MVIGESREPSEESEEGVMEPVAHEIGFSLLFVLTGFGLVNNGSSSIQEAQ